MYLITYPIGILKVYYSMDGGLLLKFSLKQDGYTLLLTLILIVLLFLVTASFTVASMSQSKQIVKTDESFVGTSLAEMGVEFADEKIKKLYNDKKSAINTYLLSKNRTELTIPEKDTYNLALKNEILAFKTNQKTLSATGSSSRVDKFVFQDVTISELNELFLVKMKIDGQSGSAKKTITATFEIDKFDTKNSSSYKKSSSFTEVIAQNPDKVVEILSGNIKNNTNLSYPGKIVHFKGDVTIGQQFNDGLVDSYYYSSGNIVFDKHSKFSNSSIESALVKIDHNSDTKSGLNKTIFLVGELDVTMGKKNDSKFLSVLNESKICIFNKTPEQSENSIKELEIDNTSWVIFKGTLNSTDEVKRIKILNSNDFLNECKVSTPILNTTFEPLVDIKY